MWYSNMLLSLSSTQIITFLVYVPHSLFNNSLIIKSFRLVSPPTEMKYNNVMGIIVLSVLICCFYVLWVKWLNSQIVAAFFGQISMRYFRIWIGSDMFVATGWLWLLKSIINTGAKQIAKFWGFILFLDDCDVTRDKWSMIWTKQFYNLKRNHLYTYIIANH